MKKIFLIVSALLLGLSLNAQTYTWKLEPVKGLKTGVKASNTENVEETMGRVEGRKFYAPNGKVFKGGSVWKVAKLMLEAQPEMADVKTVVGYSKEEMHRGYPESVLGNWFVDNLMVECEKRTGKKVDLGIVNFGGIRINMPDGEILKDDILSMFPFKNSVVYLRLKGKDVRNILEYMAEAGFQELGGVRCVAKDHKLVSATINGKELDDNAEYGLATISFLLNGGDGLFLAKNALERVDVDGWIYDVMMDVVERSMKENKPIEYHLDGRVKLYTADGTLLPAKVK